MIELSIIRLATASVPLLGILATFVGAEPPAFVRPSSEIPRELTEPQTAAEIAQHPIWLAISQRDYRVASALIRDASAKPETNALISAANFDTHLRGLASFWRSVNQSLSKVEIGSTLAVHTNLFERLNRYSQTNSEHNLATVLFPELEQQPENLRPNDASNLTIAVKVVAKTESTITLAHERGDALALSTDVQTMPTTLAIVLFRLQHPSASLKATDPFEKYDFPAHPQLANAKIAGLTDGLMANGAQVNPLALAGASQTSVESTNSAAISPLDDAAATRGAKSSAVDSRLPIPSEIEIKKSRAEIINLFSTLYAGRSLQDTEARGTKLLEVAMGTDTTENASDQYVLFEESLAAAVAVGDVETAVRALEAMAKQFQVDLGQRFPEITKTLLTKTRTPASIDRLLAAVRSYLGQLIDDDQYETAARVLADLTPSVRKQRLANWVGYFAEQQKRIKGLEAKYAAMLAELGPSIAPTNLDGAAYPNAKRGLALPTPDKLTPAQCEVVGRFYCIDKGDRAKGLPYLARSDNADLSALATLDLNPPQDPDELIELAERWLAIGGSDPARFRAAELFLEVAFAGNGLNKAKAQKRLSDISKQSKSRLSTFVGKRFLIHWTTTSGATFGRSLVFHEDHTYAQQIGSKEPILGRWVEVNGTIFGELTSKPGYAETFIVATNGTIEAQYSRNGKLAATGTGTLQE